MNEPTNSGAMRKAATRQFDRELSDHRVRVFDGHADTGSANARDTDCARCVGAISRRQGTPIDWHISGIVRPRRRYLCAECARAIKEMEANHGEATTN